MAIKSRKKASKGRFNVLLMRSQGEVMNLAVSPVLLVIAFLFALVFVIASVNIINRYFSLFMDYRDLSAAYEETAEELSRLQSLYTYQASVADDYTNLMRAMNMADPQNGPEEAEPAAATDVSTAPSEPPAADGHQGTATQTPADDGGAAGQESGAAVPPGTGEPQTPAVPAESKAPVTLEEWSDLLPTIADPPEQVLDVERLQVSGGRFSFSLVNDDSAGRAAQGNLLMAFAVEGSDGQASVVAFPDFNLASSEPDFEVGPGYNIRSGKTVNGRISLPAGAKVTAMMVAAKSRAGNVVLKKLLTTEE
ncbi:hypothetical protein C4J81_12515 [Deltaproteobacteria bacterium Smac51]|nr:hypothetical protein C4J81_12515 [Deltaproteobacteria bacterium Smac51]